MTPSLRFISLSPLITPTAEPSLVPKMPFRFGLACRMDLVISVELRWSPPPYWMLTINRKNTHLNSSLPLPAPLPIPELFWVPKMPFRLGLVWGMVLVFWGDWGWSPPPYWMLT